MRRCEYCQTELTGPPQQRFCNRECCDRQRRRRECKARVMTCAVCGKAFRARGKRAKVCGPQCRQKRNYRAGRGRTVESIGTEKQCPVCFKRYRKTASCQRYCCDRCQQTAQRRRQRRSKRERVSVELIVRRAAAIRAGWDEDTRIRRLA
jgi:hypothetical protein